MSTVSSQVGVALFPSFNIFLDTYMFYYITVKNIIESSIFLYLLTNCWPHVHFSEDLVDVWSRPVDFGFSDWELLLQVCGYSSSSQCRFQIPDENFIPTKDQTYAVSSSTRITLCLHDHRHHTSCVYNDKRKPGKVK